MAVLAPTRARFAQTVPGLLAGLALVALVLTGATVVIGQQNTYALYTPEGRRNLVVRDGSPETIALEQLTAAFGLTFTEDRVANGLVIGTRKGSIVVVPGQSFIQVAGRGVVGLDGPIRRRAERLDRAD